MTISPARACDLPDALAILHGSEPTDQTNDAGYAFQLCARGEVNPDDVFVAWLGDRMCGAVYCSMLPGASAVMWPPRTVVTNATIDDGLMAAALSHVSTAKVVQAFLSTAELVHAGVLMRAGFQRATRVWEMQATTDVSRCPRRSQIDLTAYPDADPVEFLDVLVRCHEESLDCPELNGLRTHEELLAGFQECASDPARWWLARDAGEAVGVLILGAGELVFLGVVPNRRGSGIGRDLLHFALATTRPLSLIVDARNIPAIQLYSSLEFTMVGSREVFLLVPDRSAGGP